MPLVTLIGEDLAIEGNEFIYLGPNNECRNCKLKTVCFNLKTGRKYKIEKVRDKHHDCSVHERTTIVVEVIEMPIFTAINAKHNEGVITKIEKNDCRSIGCPNYELCSVTINKDKKFKIIKIYEDIDCPIGYILKKAELQEE
jgi:uncharacterized protein (UPF0179 family)